MRVRRVDVCIGSSTFVREYFAIDGDIDDKKQCLGLRGINTKMGQCLYPRKSTCV